LRGGGAGAVLGLAVAVRIEKPQHRDPHPSSSTHLPGHRPAEVDAVDIGEAAALLWPALVAAAQPLIYSPAADSAAGSREQADLQLRRPAGELDRVMDRDQGRAPAVDWGADPAFPIATPAGGFGAGGRAAAAL
jgi:hypothetical protein